MYVQFCNESALSERSRVSYKKQISSVAGSSVDWDSPRVCDARNRGGPALRKAWGRQRANTTKPGWLARLFLLWSWFNRSCFDRRPRILKNQGIRFGPRAFQPHCCVFPHSRERPNLNLRCGFTRPAPRGALYITIARFSSSCTNTGMAHPAISTRPAASSAALGETP